MDLDAVLATRTFFEEAVGEATADGAFVFKAFASFLASSPQLPLTASVTEAVGRYLAGIRVLPSQGHDGLFGTMDQMAATIRSLTELGKVMLLDLGESDHALLSPDSMPLALQFIAAWRARIQGPHRVIPTGGATNPAHVNTELFTALAALTASGSASAEDATLRELSMAATGYIAVQPTHSDTFGAPLRPTFAHLDQFPGLARAMGTNRHAYADIGAAREQRSNRDAFSTKFGRFTMGSASARPIVALADLFSGRLTMAEKNEDARIVGDITSELSKHYACMISELECVITPEHAHAVSKVVAEQFTAAEDGGIISTIVPAFSYLRALGKSKVAEAGTADAWPKHGVPWSVFVAVLLAGMGRSRTQIAALVQRRRQIIFAAAGYTETPRMQFSSGFDYIGLCVTADEKDRLKQQFKGTRTPDHVRRLEEESESETNNSTCDGGSSSSSVSDNTRSQGKGREKGTRSKGKKNTGNSMAPAAAGAPSTGGGAGRIHAGDDETSSSDSSGSRGTTSSVMSGPGPAS